ncbi:CsgG/HfaB family protein [bacterium]|nr:CsgG/HfaB family protein [bacterium]
MKSLFFLLLTGTALTWSQNSNPVVAVLDFNSTSKKFYLDDVVRSFPTQLQTELSQKRSLVIVERRRIDDVMREQDFVLTDLAEDKDKQAKVGNLLGADYLITGDISESEGKLRIDVAVTQISSGRVIGEKAIVPSKNHVSIGARLLAQNIAFELTGEGSKIQSISLRGAPTMPLFLSTVMLAAGTGLAYKQSSKFKDDYKASGQTLKGIQDNYDKANKWNKTGGFLAGATAVSLGAYIYALIKNKSSDLELLAMESIAGKTTFALQPVITPGRSAGIDLSIKF